jgi:hypothetical protein
MCRSPLYWQSAACPSARFSIDDKQLCPDYRVRAVRFCVVCDLVAHTRIQRELATVSEFCVQLAVDTQDDVTLAAPMICEITRRLINHANADVPKVLSAPVGQPGFAFVLGSLDL